MNLFARIALAAWFVFAGRGALSSAPTDVPDAADDGDDDLDEHLGDDFVFDVVARANETVVSNIDSADLALLGVLAALAAVVVFGIEKIRELAAAYETWAVALLGGSAVACISGYLFGIWRARDSIDARTFVIDFAADPENTTANATQGAVSAYARNIRDRTAKRFAVAAALLLLGAGTIVVAVASFGGGVVSSSP